MARFLRCVLIAVALVIILLDFFGLEDFANSPYHGIRHSNLVFLEYFDDSPAKDSGLIAGDRIFAVDGVPVRNIIHFKYLTYSNLDHRPQTYTIARGDSLFHTKIEYISQPRPRFFEKIALSFVAFTFILVGFYLILKRHDILGRLFSINCFIFSFLLTERPAVSTPVLHVIGELFYDCLFAFLPAVFLHFFLIFPGKDIHRGSRRSMLTKWLYLPPSLIFISFFVLALMNYSSEIDPSILLISNSIVSIYWVLYMIGGVTMFIRTYMTSDSIQKIKFRIAALGLVTGTVPVTAVIVLRQFVPSFHLPLEFLSMISLSFISISFAYAILKHDAFDMRKVFKAGLAYVILPIFFVGLFYFSAKAFGPKFPNFPGGGHYPTILASVLLALIAVLLVKAEIQNFVDRLFMKDRKVFRSKVIEFSRRIQFLGSIKEISDFAVSELKNLLKSEHIHIFLKDGSKKFIHRQSSPAGIHIPLTEFPDGIEIINMSREKRRPIMVEYYDRLWINNNLDRISIELISLLNVSVILPLIEQNEMLGFILLGKKRSGKPYNRTDAEILELIGERCSAAIRHNILFNVSVEKEKLEKEVRLASEIQKRLLPENPPELNNTSISGRLLNSMDVGGDFYDFVEFTEEVVGIAVADVSGKGIPASLLMTTLQASFRSEATTEKSPAEVITALNKSLYRRSELSKFATFFYAKYDDSSGLLRYSNGGSFPPLLIRQDGKIEQLKRGGILVGVDPDSYYNEGAVMLFPGDLLMIYTDGVIDQENSKGDYFGEERLTSFLKSHTELKADEIIRKLYEAIRIFGEGSFKDDMTSVILKRRVKIAAEAVPH
ncbi:MAG: SpoIIE family protein phosphatase [Candidatus Krumholzibacteriota bacterium]|nr:SpoIIE family protein phosphatase [Candidatus Krumholzibacteriota bacterium]